MFSGMAGIASEIANGSRAVIYIAVLIFIVVLGFSIAVGMNEYKNAAEHKEEWNTSMIARCKERWPDREVRFASARMIGYECVVKIDGEWWPESAISKKE